MAATSATSYLKMWLMLTPPPRGRPLTLLPISFLSPPPPFKPSTSPPRFSHLSPRLCLCRSSALAKYFGPASSTNASPVTMPLQWQCFKVYHVNHHAPLFIGWEEDTSVTTDDLAVIEELGDLLWLAVIRKTTHLQGSMIGVQCNGTAHLDSKQQP